MRKRGIDKDVVLLLMTTLVTFATWVGFEVYRAYTTIGLPPGIERHMQPINSELNQKVLDKLGEIKTK